MASSSQSQRQMSNSTPKELPELQGKCAVCDKLTDMKCQGCVKAGKPSSEMKFYCGKEHQELDWKNGHETICSASRAARNLIFQFKITLLDVKPPIWRRIQLKENSTFRELHKAISLSMGWFETHLHEFRFRSGLTIGMPDPDTDDEFYGSSKTSPEKNVKLVTLLNTEGRSCKYEYDFGDGWIHKVLLEKILPADENMTYPVCVGGRRACPPEDCGGTDGYADLLATCAKPAKRRTKKDREKLEWLQNHPLWLSKLRSE